MQGLWRITRKDKISSPLVCQTPLFMITPGQVEALFLVKKMMKLDISLN